VLALMLAAAVAAEVVAPMTDIAAYDRLDEGDLTLVEIPDELLHPHHITALPDAVGRIATEPLFTGEPLRTERLGTDARSVLLGPDDDLVLLPLPRPEHWEPGRVDLVALGAPGAPGPCLLAQDVRSHGTAEPGMLTLTAPAPVALALRWRLERHAVVPLARNPVDRERRNDRACPQQLPISRIQIPRGLGALVGLPGPAVTAHSTHPDRALPRPLEGADVVWIHGQDVGRTGVRVDLVGDRPPLVLDVVVSEEPTQGQPLPPGGYAALTGEGAVHSAAAWPEGAVELQLLGDQVLAFGRTPGLVEVAAVHDDGVALHTLEVLPGWPAVGRGEVVVPLRPGKRRKLKVADGIGAVFSADRSVALIEGAGTKARITGVAPGTTEVVVQGHDGRLTHVRVVVLER